MQVVAGVSDGNNTAITADGLHEGDEIVLGEVFAPKVELKNPFLTKRNR